MIRQREYSPVARSYAAALLGTARRLGRVNELDRQTRALATAFARSPRTTVFLDHPRVPAEKKIEYLNRVFGDRIEPALARMLELLVLRARMRYLVEILDRFHELVEREQGIGQAIVLSARPLEDAERRRLLVSFERYTGNRLHVDWRTDARLLGGIVFRFRDLLVDGSVRTGLEHIHERLLGTQVLSS